MHPGAGLVGDTGSGAAKMPVIRRAAGCRPARFRAAALALAILSLVAPAGAQQAPTSAGAQMAVDARVAGDGSRTRFVADFAGEVGISVFTLADPYRVVIDLPEVRFHLGEDLGKSGRGLISAFRYGMISAGKSRIVLDATGPVAVDKAFVLPPVEGQPARMVIDVVPTSRDAFLETAALQRAEMAESVAAAAPAIVDSGRDGRLRIVLDPGHGGIDSGAVGQAGTLEKSVVLAFAASLGEQLEASSRFEVFMTRDDDSFVRLNDRVEFARGHHADLFISIHADSFRGHDIRGATIYTVSEKASNDMAAAIAAGENRSDILAGLDLAATETGVADILLDLARRETKNFSIQFARDLVDHLGASTVLFKNPHQEAGFMVLMAPDVPSVLVELGYLSNADDERTLLSEAWRSETAEAVAGAIEAFFATRVAQGQ